MLEKSPEFDAKTLFIWLCEKQPGRYQEGQLRTFQRRVASWRVENGSKIATLEQVRRPGEQLQTDGTWLKELKVTINGIPYVGLLIHSVLPYSNWEWGRLAPSESLAAVHLGLQSTLKKLGAVPAIHQTDNSSAATKKLGAQDGGKSPDKRGFTIGYLEILKHFGMEPSATHVGNPNENGDVESSNGGLKHSLKQHLLLRGNREFETLAAFEAFVHRVMDKLKNILSNLVRIPIVPTVKCTCSIIETSLAKQKKWYGGIIECLRSFISVAEGPVLLPEMPEPVLSCQCVSSGFVSIARKSICYH